MKNANSICDIHSKNDALLNFGSSFNSSFFNWSVPNNFINSRALEHKFLLENLLYFFLFILFEIVLFCSDELVVAVVVDDDAADDDDELDELEELEELDGVELADDE